MDQKPRHGLEIGLAGQIGLFAFAVIRTQAEVNLIRGAEASVLQLVFHDLIPALKPEIFMNDQFQAGLCCGCCDGARFCQRTAERFLTDNGFDILVYCRFDCVCLLIRRQDDIQNVRLCFVQHFSKRAERGNTGLFCFFYVLIGNGDKFGLFCTPPGIKVKLGKIACTQTGHTEHFHQRLSSSSLKLVDVAVYSIGQRQGNVFVGQIFHARVEQSLFIKMGEEE